MRNSSRSRIPDFFLVGAPKSGTTSMYEYLRAHPRIYMPRKEIHHFGSDLAGLGYVDSREAYLELFAGARDDQLIGDASVYYLYSSEAAAEIYEANPAAGIIAMLRNPIEMIPSLHAHRRRLQAEPIADLEEALGAEAARSEGRRLPKGFPAPHRLLYRRVASYSEQLQRYFELFGTDRVLVLLFDDFTDDVRAAYEKTLDFLGVPSDHRDDFVVHNPGMTVRVGWLQHSLVAWRRRTKPVRNVVPARVRHGVSGFVTRLNTRPKPRSTLAPNLLDDLRDDFRDEVGKLSALIGRDLSHWLKRGP